MKHWAYIGLALIVANVSLWRVVRAAEVNSGRTIYARPAFSLLRWSDLIKRPEKARPTMIYPVTVGLFDGKPLQTLWLRNPGGFYVSGRKIKSPIFVGVQDDILTVYHAGEKQLISSALTITAADDKSFELLTRQGSIRWTRGEIQLTLIKQNMRLVNRLELEDYVSGILEGELGSLDLNPEVLKAQLVVARSYVLTMNARHRKEGFEFCDQPHCQVYKGIPQKWSASYEVALMKVRGQYLSHRGHAIPAFYHHNCGGMTSAVEDVWPIPGRPFLRAVREPVDSSCQLAPKSRWRVSLSKKSLTSCFRKAGWLKKGETLEAIHIIRKDPSNRVQQLLIQGDRRQVKVTVGRFRNVVNQYYWNEYLKSAMFTIASGKDAIVFSGRGWGHGIGFCQEGAMWMARHSKTYEEILKHYYPNTTLAKLKQS